MAWLRMGDDIAAIEHQCTSTGVIEQDNFHPILQGKYCTTTANHAKGICENGLQTRCDVDCQACNGTVTSFNCTWTNSATPGDSVSIWAGCQANQYGNHYRVTCGCSYPPPPCNCQSSETCCTQTCSGTWMDGMCNTGSPLIISLERGLWPRLTSADDGVWFDLNRTGTTQRTAWTRAGTDVGFLALDRNENGVIDDGSELFGTSTSRPNGFPAGNGFRILADLDADSGAPDGRIDAADEVFARLRLWIDANHNGYSENDELLTMGAAGITALHTAYRDGRYVDEYGNRFKFVGTLEVRTRRGRERRDVMWDVFFRLET